MDNQTENRVQTKQLFINGHVTGLRVLNTQPVAPPRFRIKFNDLKSQWSSDNGVLLFDFLLNVFPALRKSSRNSYDNSVEMSKMDDIFLEFEEPVLLSELMMFTLSQQLLE